MPGKVTKIKKGKSAEKLKQDGGLRVGRRGIKTSDGSFEMSKTWIIFPPLLISLLAVGFFFTESWLMGPTLNQPLDAPRAVSAEWRNDSVYNERMWGTYRSNVYFGVRPRIPKSLVAGILWMVYDGQFNLRHTCEHGDNLQRYGWIRHDGTTFGQQEIVDNVLSLRTEFLSRYNRDIGDTWTARVRGQSRVEQPQLVTMIMYIYNEGEGEMACSTSKSNAIEEIFGHTPEFSQYRVYFPRKAVSQDAVHNYMVARLPTITNLSGYIKSIMKLGSPRKKWPQIAQLPGEVRQPGEHQLKANFIAYQVTTLMPFEVDMVFETGALSAALSISGERFTTELASRVTRFDERFEERFGLREKGFTDQEIDFAKAAFSNLVGSISYFYGQSKVMSKDVSRPLDYWPAELYTGVPSRSFFPRGFLWDEGFHQILLAHWDTTIVKDVISHWMDLINVEGWIPREQILGDEARSKVPADFVVQHNENANPPTFFLTLETLVQQMKKDNNVDVVFLSHLYPRLQVWFEWFNETQAGDIPSTYRWRGRNETTDKELNPKTLTSGLDDFPRATHPSREEYHVDLRCWMALASGVLAKIADILGKNSQPYKSTYKLLSDQTLLDRLHWDSKKKMYSDFGLHSSSVKLVTVKPQHPNMPKFKRRKVAKEPTLRFVNSFGYVNLFPFLLRIVSPNSDKLGYILERLRNDSYLWTDYGLRSLSRTDPFYNKYNTEHDPPYWRGAIWINMNYMAVRALNHYGNVEGPHQNKAKRLYQELRSNLIQNMFEQYTRSGYVWEQYDDRNGAGKGTHPFTGWSSLVVLIMAEKY